MSKQIPITPDLFTWPSEQPRLIGGTCLRCGTYFFPKHMIVHSPQCPKEDVHETLLGPNGTLISYTWQYYQPPPPYKGPEPYVPFGIGVVEFKEGVRVHGMLTGCKLDDLKLNMNVRLIIEKLYSDEQGNEYLTWKFRPV